MELHNRSIKPAVSPNVTFVRVHGPASTQNDEAITHDLRVAPIVSDEDDREPASASLSHVF
jgi:hypothetical protein